MARAIVECVQEERLQRLIREELKQQLDAGGMRENVRDTPCLKLQFGKKSSQTLR